MLANHAVLRPGCLQAGRRVVKGRRQNLVEVTLEGEGKLGLVFAKDSEPPEIKEVKPSGLAAKVWRELHNSSQQSTLHDT